MLSLVAVGAFGAALADDDEHVWLNVFAEGTGDDAVRVELDSDEMGFSLHDMQEGENRSVVDKQGRTILVTREADGYTFDVDGKTIKMPLLKGVHGGMAMMRGGNADNVDVRVLHHGDMTAEIFGGTTIITGKPVDDATQQAIRSLLESAGYGSDVKFIDHESAADGSHVYKFVNQVDVVSD